MCGTGALLQIKIKKVSLKVISHEHRLQQAGGILTRTLLEGIFRVKHFTTYFQTFVKRSKICTFKKVNFQGLEMMENVFSKSTYFRWWQRIEK